MVLKVLRVLFLLLIGFTSFVSAQCINTFPNTQTFESGPVWTTGGTSSDWTWGTPNKPVITGAGAGTKCWITAGLTGSVYKSSQQSYIVSPCYDFTTLTYPHVKFKIFWETEYKFDGGNLQYSINNGTTWINVGAVNDPVNCMTANWYNYSSITYLNNPAWISTRHGWAGNTQASYQNGGVTCQGGNGSAAWVVAQHCLNGLAGQPNVKFRFTFASGTTCNSYDGLAIDDFTIENGPPNTPTFTYSCTSGNTVAFTSINSSCPIPSAYSWDFGDASSGASNTSAAVFPTHTFSGPGVYTVTLTTTGGPCNPPGSISIPVTILSASASITNVTCNGSNDGSAVINVSGGAGPYTYSWSPGGQVTSSAAGLSAGTYTVNISAANSCPISVTATITQPSALTATTSITPVNCFGNNDGTATVIPSGGTAPYTYSWAPSGGNASTATGLSPGAYTVTVKDLNNCTATKTAIVTQPLSALSASATNTPVSCFGENTGIITISPSGGTSPYAYSWSPSVSIANNASGLSAGTYSITVTDAHNCSFVVTSIITQPATGLTVSTVNTPVSCFGGSNGTITATPANGVAPYNYSWTSSGSTSATATALPAGTYTVNVIDASGCSAIGTGTVVQPASAISVTAAVNDVSCFGGNNGSIAVAPVNGTAPYSYSWSPVATTTATASGLTAGTYTVTVTDANGCFASAPNTITQPSSINVTVSNTPVSCNGGNNGTATATPSGGTAPYTYAWGAIGETSATAIGLTAGTYTVTINDFNNCNASANTTISEPLSPLSVSSVNTNVSCFGGNNGTITLSANGGTAPYQYSWPSSINSTTSNAAALAAGTYSVNVTDANGCVVIFSSTITQPAAPLSAMATSTPSLCISNNGTATVNVSGGTDPYSYSWSPSGGSASNAAGLAPGTYTVNITDANNCLISSTVTVNDTGSINVSITSTPIGCSGGTTGTASALVTGGTAPFSYSWNIGQTSPTLTNIGSGTYCVRATDANGCNDSACIALTDPPQINAEFASDPLVTDISDPVINFNDQSVNAATWQWNFGDASLSSTINNPVHTYENAGTYPVTLIVTTTQGCVDTVTHVVIINELFTFYAPNAITPDGNGNNEIFLPKGTYWNPAKFNLNIFDRWGNLIFHSTDMNKGWNGKVKSSEIAQIDVYVWKVELSDLSGRKHNYIGSVTIVK